LDFEYRFINNVRAEFPSSEVVETTVLSADFANDVGELVGVDYVFLIFHTYKLTQKNKHCKRFFKKILLQLDPTPFPK